jgi:predicted nucleotidyltransferase
MSKNIKEESDVANIVQGYYSKGGEAERLWSQQWQIERKNPSLLSVSAHIMAIGRKQ